MRFVAAMFLKLMGWHPVDDVPPPLRRYVMITAPHTSNWDLVWLLAFATYWGLRVRWMGKQSLFEPPFGFLLRWAGGMPIDRSRSDNVVKRIAAVFEEHDDLILAVPAEGTRGRREHWKSGFYYIALEAGVPIVAAYLDYGRREAGFGQPIHPSGDIRADMDRIRGVYAGKQGRRPEMFTPPRLAVEDEAEAAVQGSEGGAPE